MKAVPDEKAAGGFRFKPYLHNLSICRQSAGMILFHLSG